jgi:hypothetical protein
VGDKHTDPGDTGYRHDHSGIVVFDPF